MSYGLLGLRKQMETEAMQGLGDLSNQQREAKRAEDRMDQAEKSQQMSAVGTGAATGAMVGATYGGWAGPIGAVIGAGVGYIASELM